MAVILYGGGGGGPLLGQHSVDGDTVEHWAFDGDTLGDIGTTTTDFDSGRNIFAPFPGGSASMCVACPNGDNTDKMSASGTSGLISTEMTMAALVFQSEFPGGITKIPLWRFEARNGGADDVQWLLTCDPSTGAIRVGHIISGPGFVFDDLALTIPTDEWVHVAMTRNAAGTGGHVYVNDTREAWSVATAPDASAITANTVLCLGNGSGGTPDSGFYMSSLIIKDIECSEAQVAAMRGQCGL